MVVDRIAEIEDDYLYWLCNKSKYGSFAECYVSNNERRIELFNMQRPEQEDYGFSLTNPIMVSTKGQAAAYLNSLLTLSGSPLHCRHIKNIKTSMGNNEADIDVFQISAEDESFPDLYICTNGRSSYFKPKQFLFSEDQIVIYQNFLKVGAPLVGMTESGYKNYIGMEIQNRCNCDWDTAHKAAERLEKPLKYIYCSCCGKEIFPEAKFCGHCGCKNNFVDSGMCITDYRSSFSLMELCGIFSMNKCPECGQYTDWNYEYCSCCGFHHYGHSGKSKTDKKLLLNEYSTLYAYMAPGIPRPESSICIWSDGSITLSSNDGGATLYVDQNKIEQLSRITDTYNLILPLLPFDEDESRRGNIKIFSTGCVRIHMMGSLKYHSREEILLDQSDKKLAANILIEFFQEFAAGFNSLTPDILLRVEPSENGYYYPALVEKNIVYKRVDEKEKSTVDQSAKQEQAEKKDKKSILGWLRRK